MNDPLLRWRAEFPILATSTYLISNSLGAMPRGVRDDLAQFAETWATRGVRAWAEGWWELPVEAGNAVATLLKAPQGSISMHQNVTLAEAAVLSCFEFTAPRNRIVTTKLNFPSLTYLQRGCGAELVALESEDGIGIPTEAWLNAIDERTKLVALDHVLFRSAYIQDAETIIRHAHTVGALVILDTFQSAGVVPVDLTAWDADFAVGGALKWLCGGPGSAYLYVRPDLAASLEPRLTGWQSHTRPFGFEWDLERREDAYRFLTGTPAVPSLYASEEGLRILNEIGVDAIRAKSSHQTRRLLDLADAHGWPTHTPRNDAQRGGTVAFDVPHALEASRELLRRDVVVDYRPGAGIRMSPHFYTTDDELDFAADELNQILASGAWKAHEGHQATVT